MSPFFDTEESLIINPIKGLGTLFGAGQGVRRDEQRRVEGLQQGRYQLGSPVSEWLRKQKGHAPGDTESPIYAQDNGD
jgi:hypothetical protein